MHLRSRQAASQYRSTAAATTADLGVVVPRSGSVISADSAERTEESQAERVAYSKQKGKKRRRKRRLNSHEKRASKAQLFFGGFLTVFLLIFISGIDFQDETKKNKSIQQKDRLRTSSAANNPNEKNINRDIHHPPIGPGECMSDGHCPVHSSCAAPARDYTSNAKNKEPSSATSNNNKNGVCEPIEPKGTPGSSASADSKCLDACLQELERDEHWYHESKVRLEWSEAYESQGRPKGCLVIYTREAEKAATNRRRRRLLSFLSKSEVYTDGMPQDLLDWADKRFHHVKRVDPFDATNLKDNRWMAYCTAPCRSHSDCATPNSPTAFVCHDSACVRRKVNNGQVSSSKAATTTNNMVIVTGATSSYFRGLTNLAASARYWAPQYRMVVYNLGMKQHELDAIRQWSNVVSVEWPGGIPAAYPPHVHKGKIYAWKPLIVNETVHKYGAIFWIDAGSTLAGPIDPVVDATLNTGIMLMKGQDLSMKMSAEATYKWFGYDKSNMQTGPHFSGNTQAFLYPSRYIDTIVIPNAKCALDSDCISPKGASIAKHRYDQTSISILAYNPKVQLPHYTEYLAAKNNQLNPDLSKPSYKFVWTSRQSCSYYAEHDDELKNARRGSNFEEKEKMRLRGGERHQVDTEKEKEKQEQAKLQRGLLIEQQKRDNKDDTHRERRRIGLNFGGGRRRRIADDAPKFSYEQQIANEEAELARQNAGGDGRGADDDDEDVDPL